MTALRRLTDWPARMQAHLAAHRGMAFAWGVHDCVRFAAGHVAATTGSEVLPAQWGDMRQAAQLLRQYGGLAAAVDTVLPRLRSPAWAQRGDIALMHAPAARMCRRWLAVVDGDVAWAPHAAGLQAAPMALAVVAWGVGHG